MGQTSMQHLHHRRPLGQRLTDQLLVAAIFPFVLVAVYAVTREGRKAATR